VQDIDLSVFHRLKDNSIKEDLKLLKINLAHIYFYYIHGYEVFEKTLRKLLEKRWEELDREKLPKR
jgi:hypothetical protein